VDIAGITVHPDEPWMKQIGRNVTMEGWGALRDCRYLLHDRDTKFTWSFLAIIASVLLIGERSLLRIIMRSVIIRGRTTSCCFLVTRKRDEAALCNVAKGLAGCCIIIIKKPRNQAEKSRMMLWLEVGCNCARTTRFNCLNRSLGSIF
jgi:hypothetical protein